MELQVILELIIILIGLYLALFKSYFQEKGKNLATKEDIEEITRRVENIKNDLLYTTQSKISLRTEERNALINCYERYSYWLNCILESYPATIDNLAKLSEMEEKLKEASFQYELSVARMNLFVNNSTLTSFAHEINLKTLAMHQLVSHGILQFQHLCEEMQFLRTNTPIQDQFAPHSKLLKKKEDIARKLNKDKVEEFKSIGSLDVQFRNMIYHHLQSLLK